MQVYVDLIFKIKIKGIVGIQWFQARIKKILFTLFCPSGVWNEQVFVPRKDESSVQDDKKKQQSIVERYKALKQVCVISRRAKCGCFFF